MVDKPQTMNHVEWGQCPHITRYRNVAPHNSQTPVHSWIHWMRDPLLECSFAIDDVLVVHPIFFVLYPNFPSLIIVVFSNIKKLKLSHYTP
jgi:hypothetical protein